MGYVVAMETESPRPDCTRCKELEKQVAELAAEVKRLAKKLEFKTRVVRRCFLLGNDPVTGKNYDHRKVWIEQQLQRLAANFGIDLLCFSILSNHFHLILRSRPDVVVSPNTPSWM